MISVSSNTPGQVIKKRTITTSEYYDEEGRLTSKDVVEEIEYELVKYQNVDPYGWQRPLGEWWQSPVVSGGSVHRITDPYDIGKEE